MGKFGIHLVSTIPALLLAFAPPALAARSLEYWEQDLTHPVCTSSVTYSREFVSTVIPADLARPASGGTEANREFSVRILREDHGQLRGVARIPVRLYAPGVFQRLQAETDLDGIARIKGSCYPGTRTFLVATLWQPRFQVTNGLLPYQLTAEVPCGEATEIVYRENSAGANVLGIWEIAARSERKLEAAVGLSFWKLPIELIWPAKADHYGSGKVHLVSGTHWDIVGHELAHAFYAQAGLGVFAQGAHRIDECYSPELAFAEGWATFFSAWLSLDLEDPDPMFEFLSPRVAPVRIENIPQDVCQGETNEWRVAAFFWDLVDRHEDGENLEIPFGLLWKALRGTRTASASQARDSLIEGGVDRGKLDQVWKLDFGK
ncbi:MAG: hypothetical protein NDJ89_16430 [Oligoflexia bacterium]|nr:hypothetical protein [Oligoflexia bacterium]